MNRDAVTFAAAGDVQLGDSAICPGFGVASRLGPRGGMAPFERIARFLKADLTLVNLETVLSRAGVRDAAWSSMQMRGYREYATAMARAGITVANVANNHAVQHGERAFEETLRALDEAGIRACGVAGSPPWSSHPAKLDVRVTSVGVLGYSLRPRQFSDRTPPYAEGRGPEMLSDVRRLAGMTDHLVVTLHWGEEFVDRPSTDEMRLAHELVAAGASLLIGHHPHVLRPVEAFEGGVVAYSLGNLVSDMIWWEPLRTGGLLRGQLRGRGDRKIVADLELLRTRIRDDFVPEVVEALRPPAVRDLTALDTASYARAVAETVSLQRRRAYRYAVANLRRYPPGLLLQLARRTAANKIRALAGRD